MQFKTNHSVMATAGLIAALAGSTGQAATVVNGGFETGSFSGWTLGGDVSSVYVADSTTQSIFDGTYSAALGPYAGVGTLSQSIATVAGDKYTLSFYLSNLGGSPSSFSATIGNASFSLPDDFVAFPYARFSLSTVATGATTSISFAYTQSPHYWLLDDVSVAGVSAAAPVPEPSAWALMFAGLAVVGRLALRRSSTGPIR